MTEAPTLAALAEAIDVPADALEPTAARWNEQAARGGGYRLRPRQEHSRPLVG